MDNRVFNVNGSGDEMLLKALELVFMQEGKNTTCTSWTQSKDNGLMLCWCEGKGLTLLPSPLTAKECLPFILSWLNSDFAKTVSLSEWCNDLDHDGHNSNGWQVYCEGWGHVGGYSNTICAIKPALMWHGK